MPTAQTKPPVLQPGVTSAPGMSGKCTSCHTGNLYRDKLDTTCISCHRKDDKHKTTLGTECSSCHSERGWREVRRFDHDRTAFPLLGRHIRTDCKSCHQSLVYREAPSTCIGSPNEPGADRSSRRNWLTT